LTTAIGKAVLCRRRPGGQGWPIADWQLGRNLYGLSRELGLLPAGGLRLFIRGFLTLTQTVPDIIRAVCEVREFGS
jgi:hypothetical protein